MLAGSVAAVGGLAVGMLAVAIASRARFAPSARQLAALAAVVLAVAGGVAAVRGDALEDFLRFLGVRDDAPVGVETYSQRTVLAYIGLRIFQDNPVAGVGWQRSSSPEVFEPYVPDARKRFPDVVELAFPSRENRWGVQNLYIQVLADAGIVGLRAAPRGRRLGARARVANGATRSPAMGGRGRPRLARRAPDARRRVGLARDRLGHPDPGGHESHARSRGSRRGER